MRRPTAVLTRDDAPLTGVSPSPFGMTAADLVKPLPSRALVHAALIATQVIFGAGAVVGKLGLPAFNPLVFAAIREGLAGPLLAAAAVATTGLGPSAARPHWRRFAFLAATIYLNQGCMIVGLKLSSAVVGSVWQPSIPVFTSLIAVSLGWEPPSGRRLGGIAVAFASCAALVACSAAEENDGGGGANASLGRMLAGNCLFFVNCLATALYVLGSKPLLTARDGALPALCVTAWSYCLASVLMVLTAAGFGASAALSSFICADCERGAWHVPPGARWALAYWVVFQSCVSYALMTWGNKHASASLVSGYAVLQPVTSAALTELVVLAGLYANCDDNDDDDCLAPVGAADLWALGIFLGLYFVITSEPPPPDALAPLDGDAGADDGEEKDVRLLLNAESPT